MTTYIAVTPGAEEIMAAIPISNRRNIEEAGEKFRAEVASFCVNAQIELINLHLPEMTITEKRRFICKSFVFVSSLSLFLCARAFRSCLCLKYSPPPL